MGNPERSAMEWSLATLPRQLPARVLAVEQRFAGELAAQGLYPGRTVLVLGDAPFGGPRVVRVGSARLAVARRVAAAVAVMS